MSRDSSVQVQLDEHERARLRWQCRRGMRELDELLQPYVTAHLERISGDELQIFRQLLNCPDQQLLAYLMLNETPQDQGWVDVIGKIRAAVRD
jgi:antitoxin CptB